VAFCGGKITEADVLNVFGFTGTQTVAHLCQAVLGLDAPGALAAVHEQAEAGKDLSRLMADVVSHLRNLLVLKADPKGLGDEFMPEAVAALGRQAESVAMEKLLDLIEHFAGAEGRMRWAANKKMHFEVAVIRAIQSLQSATLTEVLDALTAMRGGKELPVAAPARAVQPAPAPPRRETTPKVAEPPPAAVEQTPAPPAAPAKSVEFWPSLVEAVRRDRKLISAWLEAGTLLGIEGAFVDIGFPPEQAFSRDFLEQSHKPFLEEAASAILERRVAIRMHVRDGVVSQPLPAPAPAAKRDPMEEFRNDPLIRKAIEMFKAEIQPA
jgi:DNA polymerase-3 subunit gamma/tau